MADRYEITFKEGGVGLIETLATGGLAVVVEKTVDAVSGDDNHGWYCTIKDTITEVEASKWGATKAEAQEAAFRELKGEIQNFEKEQEKEREEEKYQQQLRQKEQERKQQQASRDTSNDGDGYALLGKIIGIIIVVAAIVWFVFAIAIPVIAINFALIALIVGLTKKGWNKFLFPISLLGAIYIVLDYNYGWFTKTLVNNVSFFEGLIPIFFYINIVAGLVAAYLFVRNIFNLKNPEAKDEGEFSKRNLIIMGCLLLVGGSTIGLQTFFGSKTASNPMVASIPISNQQKDKTSSNAIQTPVGTANRDFLVSASSEMSSSYGISYNADNVKDNNLSTWWSPKKAQNCWIEIDFTKDQNVSGIQIHAGSHYENFVTQNGTNYGNLYNKNLRIKTARLNFSDGTSTIISLSDKDEVQTVSFSAHKTTFIRLTPLSYYSSTKWNDVCISVLNPLF